MKPEPETREEATGRSLRGGPPVGAGRPSVCLVAHNAYGALAGVDTGHSGGIEWQTSRMARWLAARGYRVSMVTWDEGQDDQAVIDGVRVFKMCRKDAGVKGLRFLHPKWTSLCRALQRADADLYYYNCGDLGLGQVGIWCHRHGRKYVYSVACELDCDPRLPRLRSLRERVLYRHGLRRSDRIITQTQRQQLLLREGFGLEAEVIPMPCERPKRPVCVPPEEVHDESPHVLWVGRISREKRFEWLLDVAERCPEITFDVVGASNKRSPYATALLERATRFRNVMMHGRAPHRDMPGFYRRSTMLCCTSEYEGFPNTFLEAWSYGVPVISTFDPDGLIVARGLGCMAADVEGVAAELRRLARSPQTWHRASKAARKYYLDNHTMEACMPRFENVFLEAARRPPRGSQAMLVGE